MAEAKFTPGPWKVESADLHYPFSGRVFWVTAPNAVDGVWNDAGECSEENAVLIAAAPDLYEALVALVAAAKIEGPPPKSVDERKARLAVYTANYETALRNARAAIAKANPA